MTPARRVLSLILLGGVFVMEGYDIAAMALAVPRLDAALGLPPTSFGWVFSALLIGLGAGGAFRWSTRSAASSSRMASSTTAGRSASTS